MGIKKLNKFLLDKKLVKEYSCLTNYVNTFKRNNPKKNMVIAIDFWLYAYKFKHCNDNILVGFWNQILKLLSHHILPLYVYDGKPLKEKTDTLNERQKKKNNKKNKLAIVEGEIEKLLDENISESDQNDEMELLNMKKMQLKKSIIDITKTDLENIKTLFEIMNIPYIFAKTEADMLCAKLSSDNIIHACLSDDTDMLTFGCKKTIKFHNGKVYEYDLENILKDLKLSQDQFIEMCLLFGCDYLKINMKLDINEMYELIIKHKSIENILASNEHNIINLNNPKIQSFNNNYNNIKKIFQNSYEKEKLTYESISYKPSIKIPIQKDKIINFLELNITNPENYIKKNKLYIIQTINYINHNISYNLYGN
jgi:5'-3' exonuclease